MKNVDHELYEKQHLSELLLKNMNNLDRPWLNYQEQNKLIILWLWASCKTINDLCYNYVSFHTNGRLVYIFAY